jgi:PAS domain S-box-containing protein
MSLSLRLVLLCAVAVLPAAGIQLWSELSLRAQRGAEVQAEAERAALYAASEIDRIIAGTRQLLTAMAQSPSVVARETERCSGYIADLEARLPGYARLSVADRDGRLFCVAGEVPPGFHVSDLPYQREAVQRRDFVVGGHMVGRLSGAHLLPVAMPVLGADGEVDRVAIAALDLAWLSKQLQERGLPPGGSVTVADRNGVVVARAPQAERFVGTRIPDAFLPLLHAPEPGAIDLVSQDGTRRVLGYVPLGHSPRGLYVSAGLSTEAAFSVVDRSTLIGFLLIGVGLASAMLAALVAGRLFIAPPVGRLLDAMGRWREGDTAARVGAIRGGSELTRLAAGFDSMADALQARDAALRSGEERLRLATEAASLGIWEVDLDGTEIRWSPELFVMFGLDPAADGPVTMALSLAVVHPDDRPQMQEAWAKARGNGSFAAEFRGLRRRPDGSTEERWLLSRGRVVTGRRGPVMVGVNLDITERRRAEERILLLAREVDHRAKNALAVVQAALRLTPRRDAESYAAAVEGRVAALARAQTLLAADRWSGAELRGLVEGELAAFLGAGQRVELDGPAVTLPAGVTQAIAMALHELATNAVKHGALSVPGGRVAVSWQLRGEALHLRWQEAGGPALSGAPARRGFGSRVLEGTVRGQLGGSVALDWLPEGLVCRLVVPLKGAPLAAEAAG